MEMKQKYKYVVCTRCATYNQAPFINDTLNGFSMQNTTFPVVFCIIDDASTDGEQDLLRKWAEDNLELGDASACQENLEYGEQIVATLKGKPNLIFSILLLYENHYQKGIGEKKISYIKKWNENAKYIALCEGDDFWVHSEKLQKEVDYLETHPEVGLIYTDVNRYFQDENRTEVSYFRTKISVTNSHEGFIMNSWWLALCTWLYRSELERKIPKLDKKEYFTGDTLKLLTFSKYGAVSFYNEVTAVYRVLNNSASHFLDYEAYLAFWRKNANTRTYFARELGLRFRLKYWNKIVHEERPSFKRHLDIIPTWFWFCARTLFALLIKR